MVGPDGNVKWAKEQIDPTANVMFQSGVYDAPTNRIIAVGRRTLGGDDGTCTNWSQSYIQGFAAATGDLAEPQILNGAATKGPRNRQGLYDIVPGDKSRQFAFVGFATAPSSEDGRCNDQLLVGAVSAGEGAAASPTAWRLSALTTFADDSDADEDGFAIKSLGSGDYLIAGQKMSRGADHSEAHAVRIKLSPLTIEGTLAPISSAALPSGSGPARFRVAAPIRDATHFLLAGSISEGPLKLPRAEISQIVSSTLKQNEPPILAGNGATDILDAAISPRGRTLVAGYGTDERGAHVGWLEAISATGSGAPELAPPRVAPDPNALDLDANVRLADGAFQIAVSASAPTARYLKKNVADNSQIDIALSLPTSLVLRVAALTGKGEIDLALADSSGRLVDFSNNRGSAPQLLIARLDAGAYKLSLFPHRGVKDMEIDIGTAGEVNVASLAKMMLILGDEKARIQLADQLTAAGFSEPPEPSIALGGETALSLLAAQAGVSGGFGPNAVGAQLAKTLERH